MRAIVQRVTSAHVVDRDSGKSGSIGPGLLLATLIGPRANYWTAVLPCVAVIALGMTSSAAPLTSAILNAVDAKHTGAASGLNSAVAQLGGVVVIALVGAVLALRGDALIAAFHLAAIAGSIVALAAAAAIVFLFRDAHIVGSATANGGSDAQP